MQIFCHMLYYLIWKFCNTTVRLYISKTTNKNRQMKIQLSSFSAYTLEFCLEEISHTTQTHSIFNFSGFFFSNLNFQVFFNNLKIFKVSFILICVSSLCYLLESKSLFPSNGWVYHFYVYCSNRYVWHFFRFSLANVSFTFFIFAIQCLLHSCCSRPFFSCS